MVQPFLTQKTLNKIKGLFIKETIRKAAVVRAAILNYAKEQELKSVLEEEIYVVFHSLKGTGKSVGFPEITNIAANALETIQKTMEGEISLRLFKARIEAYLCEIEEILPRDATDVNDEEVVLKKSQGTVLVVDDDATLVQAVKERLTLDGFEVLEATSAREAVSILKRKQVIDLMIIDIVMPEGNGFELCAKIRKEKVYEDTPIIFMTAETSLDKKLEGFKIGADDYVVKPISLDEIAAKVQAIVNRTRRYKMKLQYDELTEAYNRSFLQEKVQEEMARSKRTGKCFGFCMIDIDHFKKVNDTYGHLVGDEILRAFVKFLKLRIRLSDAVIRYGGEEFVLVLSQIAFDEANRIVNRLREDFSKQKFEVNGESFSVSFSAGVAVYPDDSQSLTDLIAAADRALYHAKQSGRNKICCCERN
ncbi:response regulator receiver modulated diguanylate cyclase [Desulforamulus reducens MI-1]|uniref:Stage 0 sporulation protein A homolog n=1 Tax=Desulforamulus reducens (strain ATCC BAA-1160 / DSM 100696 / MI-1) TaxID=349161 RepID=A4J4S9_DESRM|nr:diguanylate cyclase [Desulforamulus reducens]ABO50082.1 response regulator receiver modulated diguanylate cyclase [Desulforamulus reducens MI-1]